MPDEPDFEEVVARLANIDDATLAYAERLAAGENPDLADDRE